MNKLPYETATAGEKALAELQRALEKFGCQSFGTMIDNEKGCTLVQFKWKNRVVNLEASWKGYANAMMKSHRWGRGYEQRALEQAKKSVCSLLRDWTKGQITAVECGVMSFEAAFMPHILLPTGERLVDYVEGQKLLGAPEPEKVVAMR